MAKSPNNHVKPTQEELEEKIKEASEINEEDLETPVEEEEQAPEEEVEETEDSDTQDEEVEQEVEPSKEIKEALKEEVKEKDKKLSASAREAQKLYAKNRVINKALADAEDVPEPTEEQLSQEFKDWDVMSDIEKNLAKETVISRSWRQVISKAKEQATKIEQWNESVEEFVGDPKSLIDNPELEGKTDEFKEFATQEANNSVPMNILVSAFLHEQSKSKQPSKGKMFEKSSGFDKQNPKPTNGKITLEQARVLREQNYEKWKEMLAAGKIEADL